MLRSITNGIVIFAIAIVGCDKTSKDQAVLSWTDVRTSVRVEMLVRQEAVDTVSTIKVTGTSAAQHRMLTDKMGLATVRFVRYEDWLLIVDNDLVMGGYNLAKNKLSSCYDTDLPFTDWSGSGTVVATKVVDKDLKVSLPPNVPHVKDTHRSSTTGAAK